MEIQDYINRIQYLKDSLPEQLNENVYPEIAESITTSYRNRIFTKGLDSNENEIGEYSTKTINVTEQQFIKKSAFVPTSKKGKSMTLKNGYKELKQVQGLKSDSVNLLYSGELKNSIKYKNLKNGFIIGFNSTENAEKSEKLENKYGKIIFQFSNEEKQIIQKQVALALRKTFQL
ncbi:hypothetical protein [Empedobacter sp.]|uniref:hypothetical protein n=1 Tax=Empedobacter sp. TaxID=1927715 RepID=UPI00289C7AC5|nr:hypothetical protein [Empedobacter sp.]